MGSRKDRLGGTAASPLPMTAQPESSSSCLGALLRAVWMLLGTGVLLFLTLSIGINKVPWFHPLDLVFWLVLAATILARLIDITRFSGRTAHGEKATLKDWRNYSLLVGGIFLVGWLAAHLFNLLR